MSVLTAFRAGDGNLVTFADRWIADSQALWRSDYSETGGAEQSLFRVRNFRSIRDEQVLSLVASSDTELAETHLAETGVKASPAAVRSAVVYGPNASGKSTMLLALNYLRAVVARSAADIQPGQVFNAQRLIVLEVAGQQQEAAVLGQRGDGDIGKTGLAALSQWCARGVRSLRLAGPNGSRAQGLRRASPTHRLCCQRTRKPSRLHHARRKSGPVLRRSPSTSPARPLGRHAPTARQWWFQTPMFQRSRFGGTPAPLLRLTLEGDQTRLMTPASR
jgi:hypothetical protein